MHEELIYIGIVSSCTFDRRPQSKCSEWVTNWLDKKPFSQIKFMNQQHGLVELLENGHLYEIIKFSQAIMKKNKVLRETITPRDSLCYIKVSCNWKKLQISKTAGISAQTLGKIILETYQAIKLLDKYSAM